MGWTVAAVGVGVLAIAGVIAVVQRSAPGSSVPDRPAPATATVTRETLVDTTTVEGKLAYGPPALAESRLSGTVTALAPIGTTVQRGQVLFRIDDTPVVLLLGDLPAYRALGTGAKGKDVRQLEQNLKILGYSGFTVDEEFTASTAVAVRHWQKDLGLTETGTVELGRVLYAHGPVRIAAHKLTPGQVATGAVLSYTGTARLVTAQVPAHDEELATPATKVTVALPSGKDAGGTVQSVRTPDDDANAGGQEPMIEVVVALDDQAAVQGIDDGPAKVRFVVQKRDNVLTVPVGALLALAEGGYGLQIIDGDASSIVAVTTGLFADGKVEVDGTGVREGLTVGMAR